MSDTEQVESAKQDKNFEFGSPTLGTSPEERDGAPLAAWGVAALIILAVVLGILFTGRKKPAAPPNTLLPADAYAANLPLTQLAMSESSNLSGGKLTYLDGHIEDSGTRTVTGVTVQVVFANDEAMPPQIETLPLTLIRTREPYIDTEAVAVEPLKPGQGHDFRLIFESIPDNWNTQLPQVRVVHATLQ
jgi:hypothetical protein